MVTEPSSIVRILSALGEPTDVPGRSLTNPLIFVAVSNEKLNMKAGRQEDFPGILLPLFPPSCEFPPKIEAMPQVPADSVAPVLAVPAAPEPPLPGVPAAELSVDESEGGKEGGAEYRVHNALSLHAIAPC